MKVYLLSTGDYSDWKLEGVFSTKEKAEAMMKIIPECNDIEEREVDPERPQGRNGLYYYMITLQDDFKPQACIQEKYMDGSNDDGKMYKGYGTPYFYVNVWAENIEHAIKIASDKKAQYLANKAGIS